MSLLLSSSPPSSPGTSASVPDRAPLLRLRDALGDFLFDAQNAHEARLSGAPRGPVTGFASLDRQIGFALAPGLHGVTGNAGAGKTAFALQIAARCGFPALYVSCEMAPGELLRRHTARETGTFLGRFKTGELTPDEAQGLALRAIAQAPLLCLLDATRAPATPAHLRDCAAIVQGEAKTLLLVIDSLQSWIEAFEVGASEYESLNAGIAALRTLAMQLGAPILFISERNRDSMRTGGLNAGAGTRKIEYGAESVLDLNRNMDEPANGTGEFEVRVRLAKNRHGTIGTEIPLLFNGPLQLFRERNSPETENSSRKTTQNLRHLG